MTMQFRTPDAPVAQTDIVNVLGAAREEEKFRERLARLIRGKTSETMIITPMMARVMLERNTGNRTLSQVRAGRYAKDMSGKSWKLTGEPVIFSSSGVLNDGQTRLTACIQADTPFESDVRFGIDRSAFVVTGCGAKRSLADVFSIQGEEYSTRLSGALNWLNVYMNGAGVGTLSHNDGQQMLADNPDIRKSCKVAAHFYQQTRLMEPALGVFLHYIFALKDTDKANEFFEFLIDGAGSAGKRDPRLVIRERLIANKSGKSKLPPLDIAALTIKAWNAFRRGKQIGALKWQTNPAKGAPESFPRAN